MDETFVMAMFLAMFLAIPVVMEIDRGARYRRAARYKHSMTSSSSRPILNLNRPPG